MITAKMVIRGLSETLRYCHELYNKVDDAGQCKLAAINQAAKDALELLRETVKPVYKGDDSWECDRCGETVGWEELECGGNTPVKYRFCPGCGRKVKWDDGASN